MPSFPSLQRSHLNNEAVLYVAFEQALVGFIDLVSANQFNVCGNITLSAEIEHILRLPGAADAGSGKPGAVSYSSVKLK
jgi:hypothetical protein